MTWVGHAPDRVLSIRSLSNPFRNAGWYFYGHFIETKSDLAKATLFINDRTEIRQASKSRILSITA